MSTELAVMEQSSQVALRDTYEYSVQEITDKVAKVRQVAASVMKDGTHYGTIPGTQKPTLYKARAEILSLTFRLAPRYEGERQPIDLGNGHREYIVRCDLYHVQTGAFFGSGIGSCSTMESKYRYRPGPRESTGQPVPREYWNLRQTEPERALALIGGKGHAVGKDENGTWMIMLQGETIENPNIADCYNTVLKIAGKRAYVDAILKSTAASEVYTQDLEDMAENDNALHNGRTAAPAAPAQEPYQQPQRRTETTQAPTTQPAQESPAQESVAPAGAMPTCPVCYQEMRYEPEGITKSGKNAGKKHSAYWKCTDRSCNGFRWHKDVEEAARQLAS